MIAMRNFHPNAFGGAAIACFMVVPLMCALFFAWAAGDAVLRSLGLM